MAIIIGDIHGDFAMARAFLGYKPEAKHVSLGDLIDARTSRITLEEELECFELLLSSDSLFLWGNHDLSYLPKCPWECFGSNPKWVDTFRSLYQNSKDRFKVAYSVDGWLCTHAGVSTTLTSNTSEGPWESGNSDVIAMWLNDEFERTFGHGGPLYAVDWTRGGSDEYGGLFWYDPRLEFVRPDDRVKQIFGHTTVRVPKKEGNWVNIHIDDNSGYWVYDTDIDDFVLLRNEVEFG